MIERTCVPAEKDHLVLDYAATVAPSQAGNGAIAIVVSNLSPRDFFHLIIEAY